MAAFSTSNAKLASTPAAYGLKVSKSLTPVKPSASLTCASDNELSLISVDVGDTTVAPVGALRVTLLRLVLEEVSTADIESPAAATTALSVVTIRSPVSPAGSIVNDPSASVKA